MLRQLYQLSSGSLNPSYLTNLKAGGAGVQTAGTSVAPGISSPTLEALRSEVLDVTAPTLITAGVTLGTPAVAGKLLVIDPFNGSFGAIWKQNSVKFQACADGTYGIVEQAGLTADAGTCVSSVNGNISQGAKATVITNGPTQAFVNTTVTNTAVSAGMALASDGAGNLTYAGASPSVGTVLAVAAGSVGSGVSTPVLTNVYVGGY